MSATNRADAGARLRGTFFAIFCGRGLLAVRQLGLVPIFITFWGVDYYGSWLVLSAIPSFLSMSNLGMGTSAAIAIASEVAGDNYRDAWESMVGSLWMILGMGVVVTLATFGWMTHSATLVSGVIKSPALLVAVLLVAYFFRLLTQPAMGWWVGVGRAGRANHYGNIWSVGDLLICALVPMTGQGALTMSFVLLVWNVAWTIWFIASTCRNARAASPDFRGAFFPKWAKSRTLLAVGLGHQLSPLWQAILFQGSLVLANAFLGPAGAALWGSLRIVTRCGNQIIELVSQSVGPEFQLAAGKRDGTYLRHLHAMAVMLSLALALAIAIGLITVGPFLFDLWTHHSFVVPWLVWVIMGTSLIPFSLWWISGELQRSLNRPWRLNIWGVCIAALSVGFMAAASKYGIYAFAAGSLLFDLCMALLVLPATLTMVDDRLSSCITLGLRSLLRKVGFSA